jgi:hypothetical protein
MKTKLTALMLLLMALSGVVGYQIGYAYAPRVIVTPLVLPETLVPGGTVIKI